MTPFNPHTAAEIATALEVTGPHSYYPTDEECRSAAAQLRAAIGEVERLTKLVAMYAPECATKESSRD